MKSAMDIPTQRPPHTGTVTGRPGGRSTPALTVIWHPDRHRIGEVCTLEEAASGNPQAIARLSPFFERPGSGERRPLEDSYISRATAFTIAGRERRGIEIVPEGSDTPVEVQGAPLAGPLLVTADELDAGVILLLARHVVLCLHRVQVPVVRGSDLGMVGGGDGMEKVRELVRGVAGSDVPVLIRGETGTGKELVARALVASSRRADRPFVPINMAAISASTAVAEMFGHERGAFTGAAAARGGFFGEAQGGTLFLDEIGLTPPELQRMLLRVLETGEFVPVGASRGRRADVRILAATDSNLEADIAARSFSEPLFQRLAGFQIGLPPLRERREDIGPLLLHFLKQEFKAVGQPERLEARPPHGKPWLSASQVASLAMGDWPGNIRGLRNAVRQIVISSAGGPRAVIDAGTSRLMHRSAADEVATGKMPRPGSPVPRADASRAAVPGSGTIDPAVFIEVFRRNRFSASATAAELGIPRTTVYTLMERHPEVRNINDITPADLRRQFLECDGNVDRLAERLQVSRRGLQLRLSQIFKDAVDSKEAPSTYHESHEEPE